MRLATVTASIDIPRASPWIDSWLQSARERPPLYIVEQLTEGGVGRGWTEEPAGISPVWFLRLPEIVGVVPAFAQGVAKALEDGAEIIACLHDDLEIEEPDWDQTVVDWFVAHPEVGLVGFGGGKGLADSRIYNVPYNPMQLARQDFVSNMRHAEAHGRRGTEPERVACLDGFSQIGRADFWRGIVQGDRSRFPSIGESTDPGDWNLFSEMARWGVTHHAYDAALGAWAKRLGNWELWMLPIQCHHHGGLTAVADPRYHQWAQSYLYLEDGQTFQGDQGFWRRAHRIVYDQFRDVLPIRT